MSGPNPSELGKSRIQENHITRSQVKKNIELAKFVAQNQTGPFKPKRTVTVKEKVIKIMVKIFLTKQNKYQFSIR